MLAKRLAAISVLVTGLQLNPTNVAAQSAPPNGDPAEFASVACETVATFLGAAAGFRLSVYAVDAARAGLMAAGVYLGHRGFTDRCTESYAEYLRDFIRANPVHGDPWRNWERYCDMQPGIQCRRNDPLMWTRATGYSSYWTGYSCASYGSCLLSSQFGITSKRDGVSIEDLIGMMEAVELEARQAPPWQASDDFRQVE